MSESFSAERHQVRQKQQKMGTDVTTIHKERGDFPFECKKSRGVVVYLISDDAHRRPFDKEPLRGTVTRILPAGKISHDAMRAYAYERSV